MSGLRPARDEPENRGPLLVIGYGSELRGDDAVGLRAAEAVAEWRNPSIQAVAVHQLLPELAEVVSVARAVIFVDADVSIYFDHTKIRPVGTIDGVSALGHTGDPAWLMDLAERLYGRRLDGWLVGIPVSEMGLGMSLSAQARDAVAEAVREIAGLARRYGIVVAEALCHA